MGPAVPTFDNTTRNIRPIFDLGRCAFGRLSMSGTCGTCHGMNGVSLIDYRSATNRSLVTPWTGIAYSHIAYVWFRISENSNQQLRNVLAIPCPRACRHSPGHNREHHKSNIWRDFDIVCHRLDRICRMPLSCTWGVVCVF